MLAPSRPLPVKQVHRTGAVLRHDIATPAARTYAYGLKLKCPFAHERDGQALAANGMDVGGKHVRVDRAKTGEYDHTRSVFLGNLPMDAGEEEVRADPLSFVCPLCIYLACCVRGFRLIAAYPQLTPNLPPNGD